MLTISEYPMPSELYFPTEEMRENVAKAFVESFRHRPILIVDDDAATLYAAKMTLRDCHEVTACLSAEAAQIELDRGLDPWCAVIDQQMPGKLGTVFLTELFRSHPLATRVLYTAHGSDRAVMTEAVNRAHIDYFIPKPPSRPNEMQEIALEAVATSYIRRQTATLWAKLVSEMRDEQKPTTARPGYVERSDRIWCEGGVLTSAIG